MKLPDAKILLGKLRALFVVTYNSYDNLNEISTLFLHNMGRIMEGKHLHDLYLGFNVDAEAVEYTMEDLQNLASPYVRTSGLDGVGIDSQREILNALRALHMTVYNAPVSLRSIGSELFLSIFTLLEGKSLDSVSDQLSYIKLQTFNKNLSALG